VCVYNDTVSAVLYCTVVVKCAMGMMLIVVCVCTVVPSSIGIGRGRGIPMNAGL
jgi:hypothetical protein